jgi:hypothetical protein
MPPGFFIPTSELAAADLRPVIRASVRAKYGPIRGSFLGFFLLFLIQSIAEAVMKYLNDKRFGMSPAESAEFMARVAQHWDDNQLPEVRAGFAAPDWS